MTNEQIDAIIGRQLKFFRERNGWTQKELGEKIGGLSQTYVASMESGRSGIGKAKLVEICNLFDISLSNLLPLGNSKSSGANETLKEKLISDVMLLLKAMNIKEISMLEGIAKVIAGNSCICEDINSP